MFEQAISAEKVFLTNQLQPLLRENCAYLYWRDMQKQEKIHPFYQTFFSGEVEWWLHEQKLMRGTNPRFVFTDKSIADDIAHIDQLSKQAARFDRRELYTTIDYAVKMRFNYTLRPRTALKWFVFRGEMTRSPEEILVRLRSLYGYSYLSEGMERIMREYILAPGSAERMNASSFERYITQIDRGQILEFTPREFLDLFEPMFELFSGIDQSSEAITIPPQALIVFLDDKGIYRIANEVERLLKVEQLRRISRNDLAHIVDDVITRTDSPTSPPLPKTKPIEVPFEFENIASRKPLNTNVQERMPLTPQIVMDTVTVEAVHTISQPIFEKEDVVNPLQESLQDSFSGDHRSKETIIGEKEVDQQEEHPRRHEWRSFDNEVTSTVPEPVITAEIDAAYNVIDIPLVVPAQSQPRIFNLPYVDTLIPVRDKDMFVAELCDGDIRRYSDLMDAVDAHATWKTASIFIDRFFLEHHIDPYSKIAQRFAELVYSRYVK